MQIRQYTSSALPPSGDTPDAAAKAEVLDIKKKSELIPFIGPMRYAANNFDKSIWSQVWEIWKFALGRNRMSPEEYYNLRLFDDTGRDFSEKIKFLGLTAGRKITLRCNFRRNWFGIMDNKLAFYCMMSSYGYPVPQTVAIYHRKASYPSFRMLRNADEFADFLRTTDLYPLFGKPVSSSLSLGVASLTSYNAAGDILQSKFDRSFPVSAFIKDVQEFYADGYLIQRELQPSDEVVRLCGPHLSTLRVMSICGENGPEILRTVWKLPVSGNVADNFWRQGNLLAHVDEATGVVKRLVQGVGVEQKLLSSHPETQEEIVGQVVPDWEKIVDLTLSASAALGAMRLIGWDIAITDSGPVIVEANPCPHFDLPQIASNEGMDTERLGKFVAYCDFERANLRAEKKKKAKSSKREFQSKMHKLTIGYRPD